VQLHLIIMAKINSISTIRDITKEDQEQSMTSFVTRSYLTYIQGVDYKGLNESVTLSIYYMVQNIGCIRR
jgi:hypothetical protein